MRSKHHEKIEINGLEINIYDNEIHIPYCSVEDRKSTFHRYSISIFEKFAPLCISKSEVLKMLVLFSNSFHMKLTEKNIDNIVSLLLETGITLNEFLLEMESQDIIDISKLLNSHSDMIFYNYFKSIN